MKRVVLLLTLVACADDATTPATTEGKPTSALRLAVEAASNGSELLVVAEVLDGATPLRLGAGDQLRARVGDLERELVAIGDAHGGLFPAAATVEVSMVRASGAGRVLVSMPPGFGVVGPTSVRRREPVTLAFDAAAAPTELAIFGGCVATLRRTAASGVSGYTFDGADLFLTDGLGCVASAQAVRRTNGNTFADGIGVARVDARQERTWSFRITP
jgi:hypothetical protein